MLSKTGVALRARCRWLRVFGVSARCGMRKPNTRASVKPRPVQSAGNTSIPAILVRGDHFILDLLPTLGNRRFTAAFTFFCSAGVPYWATLARAFRACALSGIGYLRLPGRANSFLLNFLRCFVLRSFAMVHHYPPVQPVNPLMGG